MLCLIYVWVRVAVAIQFPKSVRLHNLWILVFYWVCFKKTHEQHSFPNIFSICVCFIGILLVGIESRKYYESILLDMWSKYLLAEFIVTRYSTFTVICHMGVENIFFHIMFVDILIDFCNIYVIIFPSVYDFFSC